MHSNNCAAVIKCPLCSHDKLFLERFAILPKTWTIALIPFSNVRATIKLGRPLSTALWKGHTSLYAVSVPPEPPRSSVQPLQKPHQLSITLHLCVVGSS